MNPFQVASEAIRRAVGKRNGFSPDPLGAMEGFVPAPARPFVRGVRLGMDAGAVSPATLDYARAQGWLQ